VKSSQNDAYCLTPGCVKAAATLIEMIDNTKEPCDDFYEFACGNFLKETVIPDHKTSKGAFGIVRDKLNERLRKLFEGEAEQDEPRVFSSVRQLYASCMDQDLLEKEGRSTLLKKVETLGGWPVVNAGEDWNEDEFVWQKLSVKAELLGFTTGNVLSVGLSTAHDDSTKRIMEISQPSLGLQREYLIKGIDDKDVQAYYRYMVDAAVYLGANKETAEKEMKEALKFELKLAEMSIPSEEKRNKTALNNQMTIREMSKMYPDYDWVDHINELLNSEDEDLDENEIVNVAIPKFVKALAAHMPSVDKKVVANYMMWRFVKSMMSYADKEGLDIRQTYSKVITGKETIPPRWETCVKVTAGLGSGYLYFYEGSLTNAVGAMYAKKHFPADQKAVADEMVENIRAEFKRMLDELDWMDDKTRERAHVKVDSMKSFIAYAEEILDNENLNEFYDGLEIKSDSFLDNMLSLRQFINKYYTKEYRIPVDRHSWKTHGGAAIVNAFYSPNENSIQFPAGILDGVFFQADRPAYLNYGGIGMVVGHEITHGFDDQGSQKDGQGNLVDWWEKETKEKYNKKAKCIIDQYGNYSVDVKGEKIQLKGVNTQGENIADNGGFKESIRAYERLVAAHGEEPKLPGLPYTTRQLFWLSGAAVWCTAMRPETLKSRVLTDPHSPSRFRVNVPYSNIEEFSRDWGCPTGSPMNPAKKCTVW